MQIRACGIHTVGYHGPNPLVFTPRRGIIAKIQLVTHMNILVSRLLPTSYGINTYICVYVYVYVYMYVHAFVYVCVSTSITASKHIITSIITCFYINFIPEHVIYQPCITYCEISHLNNIHRPNFETIISIHFEQKC